MRPSPAPAPSRKIRAVVDGDELAGDRVAVGGAEEDQGSDEVGAGDVLRDRPRRSDRLQHLLLVLVGFAHRRIHDEPGRQGVHADAVTPELARERPGHRQDAALGADIMETVRQSVLHGGRAEIDDLAVTVLRHRRGRRLGAQETATHAHRHDAVPLVHVEGGERYRRNVRAERGVVDEDVEAAEGFERAGDHGGDRCVVGDVDAQRVRAPARGTDRLCDRFAVLEIGNHDAGAGGAERLRELRPQRGFCAEGGPGDDRHPLVEPGTAILVERGQCGRH